MLFLVGAGLSEGGLTEEALELLKRKQVKVYAEKYTGWFGERIPDLEDKLGKKVTMLERSGLEDNINSLVDQAKKDDVAVLVSGDPLVATTHKIACIEAKKADVKVKVIHASSIVGSAIGESGLDFYRFGQVCTIPAWSEHYKPVSFYETVEKNLANNLHSVLLLDYDPKVGSIQPSYAADLLLQAEKRYKKGVIKPSTRLIVLHNLSLDGEQKLILTVEATKTLRMGQGPTIMILPAKMSEVEKESTAAMLGV
ncbi:MAG: diphthine synthase [Candidatus Micrarchaeota archaeon]|nr:diphthine synthase [Candidatus Micrarchaeota archaeon]